jgi:hypothetical protein
LEKSLYLPASPDPEPVRPFSGDASDRQEDPP